MAWVTPLSPNWSLAIEEQFYLLWAPLVLWLKPNQIATIAFVALIAGIGLRFAILPGHDPRYFSQIFFFTLTHLDGLCIGILVRLSYNERSTRNALLWFARTWWMWALASAVILITDAHLAPGVPNSYGPAMLRAGFTVLSMLSAAVMMHGVLIDGWIRRAFDTAPTRRLGTYSYFIYMFHITIAFAVAKVLPASQWTFGFQCIAILALAHASQILMEGPALRLRRRLRFNLH
jgi:peptidoglycan/LPS O-acetylase OafA/YrhL